MASRERAGRIRPAGPAAAERSTDERARLDAIRAVAVD